MIAMKPPRRFLLGLLVVVPVGLLLQWWFG